MRKVKCMVTGELGNSDEFYKADNGKYYKNKEIYDNDMLDTDYRNKIFYLINSDILNKNNGNCASLIGRLIKESGLNPKIIYESIIEKYDYIKNVISRSKENDSSKIYAIFSIATKRLNGVTYAGCYEIRNNKTNAVYIGESINLFGRFTTHISELYENKHHCKRLQDDFNKTHSISDFTITPLFMLPISSIDKNELKQDTLYLESAFYLSYKKNKEDLYNTSNPYVALKNNSVSLSGYEIDCRDVLKRLLEDKYNVLPKDIRKLLKDNLKDIITCHKDDLQEVNHELNPKAESQEKNVTKHKKSETTKSEENNGLFRITNILKDLAENNIIPLDYDYSKIRNILAENNLIYIDKYGYTVATQYSLDNKLYVIDKEKIINGKTVYNYYVTQEGKDVIKNIFENYSNVDDIRK